MIRKMTPELIPRHQTVRILDKARQAGHKPSTGCRLARRPAADLRERVRYCPDRNSRLLAEYFAGFQPPARVAALSARFAIRLAADCSRHCPTRWSTASSGPFAPALAETPSTLSRSGPSSGHQLQPLSGRETHCPALAASGLRSPLARDMWKRPAPAPPACLDRARSVQPIAQVAPR